MKTEVIDDQKKTEGLGQAPALSLVILCYKAGESTRDVVRQMLSILMNAGINDVELILVANYWEGSGDKTPEVVKELAENNPRIRYVAKPKAGDMGWDMKSGLALSRGRYISVIDGDGQMPLKDVVSVYEKMVAEKLDFVKTYRTTRGDGWARKMISYCYNGLFHVLFPGLYSRDINSKPKIMTRRTYDLLRLESDDWFIDAEIMIQLRRHKLKIGEVPTKFLGLKGRRSFITFQAIIEFVLNLARYRLQEFRTAKNLINADK